MLQFEKHLREERALHADMLEAMRRGAAEVVYDSENALLLKDRSWELHMLSAFDEGEGRRLLDRLAAGDAGNADRGDLVARGRGIAEYAETLGYEHTQPLVQVLYEKSEVPQAGSALTIRTPDECDFEKVAATYHIVDREQLLENFRSGEFFGGYRDGEMVGYIGLHPEGSMGMLHVFEAYRKQGYARELFAFLLRRQLRLGRLAYGQVFADNAASLALQRSFGMTFASSPVFWMWK